MFRFVRFAGGISPGTQRRHTHTHRTCRGCGDIGGAHESYQSALVATLQQVPSDGFEGFREDLDPKAASKIIYRCDGRNGEA